MDIVVPGSIVIAVLVGFASSQSVILWRLGALERRLENGLLKKMEDLERRCMQRHAMDKDRVQW